MKLAALIVEPGPACGVVGFEFMAVMTVIRVIAVRAVEVMTFITNIFCAFRVFVSVIVSVRPPGTIRCFAAV